MSESTKCPFDAVHQRLEDAHKLLHQLQEAYFDPEDFRTHLNNLIQGLRNVTFILQSNRHVVDGFDAWYEPWQKLMRADAILHWAHDARTQLVHRGDLETHSMARVAIVNSYLDPQSRDIKVPPWTSAEEIAARVAGELSLEDEQRKLTIVRVERRWVETNLPDHELLDALDYALGCLHVLVDAAHQKMAGTQVEVRFPAYESSSLHFRTAYLRLKDSRFVLPASQTIELEPKSWEELDLKGVEKPEANPQASLEDQARSFFEMARAVMIRDGYHRNVVLVVGSEIRVIEIGAEDKAAKFLIWRDIAAVVRQLQATTVICIGEVWQARWDGKTFVAQVEDLPDKKEGVSLQAASAGGGFIDLFAEIHRSDDGTTTLGETENRSESRMVANYLAPVYEAWAEMGRGHDSEGASAP